jgi:hypothetical protein
MNNNWILIGYSLKYFVNEYWLNFQWISFDQFSLNVQWLITFSQLCHWLIIEISVGFWNSALWLGWSHSGLAGATLGLAGASQTAAPKLDKCWRAKVKEKTSISGLIPSCGLPALTIFFLNSVGAYPNWIFHQWSRRVFKHLNKFNEGSHWQKGLI